MRTILRNITRKVNFFSSSKRNIEGRLENSKSKCRYRSVTGPERVTLGITPVEMPWIIDEAVVIETESTESVFPISDTSEVLASFLLDMLASFLFNLKQKQLIHRGLRALDLRYFKKDFLNKK